jgi:hypothetical protein
MKCLIVGRTQEYVAECIKYGLKSHNPAPSTLEYDYTQPFGGDVISCHTIKPWSDYACTVETSKRVEDSAMAYPAKVMVGNSVLHPVSADSPLNEFALIFKQRNPTMNSGVFAMCWAFTQGYDEIYTVGIDLVWDRELLAYVNNMFKKYPNQKVYKVSKTSWLPCEVKEP